MLANKESFLLTMKRYEAIVFIDKPEKKMYLQITNYYNKNIRMFV